MLVLLSKTLLRELPDGVTPFDDNPRLVSKLPGMLRSHDRNGIHMKNWQEEKQKGTFYQGKSHSLAFVTITLSDCSS